MTFQHKYWTFTIVKLDENYSRVHVESAATAHRFHCSWIAYTTVANDRELCIRMLERQIKSELEYIETWH